MPVNFWTRLIRAAIRHVDVAGGIGGHSAGQVELPVLAAGGAPLGQVRARARELLDPAIDLVHDVDVAGRVRRHSGGIEELPVAAAVVPHSVR